MTFHASQDDHVRHNVHVHVTSGPVEIKVTEHYMHLRSFWGSRGRLLDAVESEAAEKSGE